MKSPTVTIAAENGGRPTIGRIAMRSTPAEMAASTIMARGTATQKGRPISVAKTLVAKVPRMRSAGWAKFKTPVAR